MRCMLRHARLRALKLLRVRYHVAVDYEHSPITKSVLRDAKDNLEEKIAREILGTQDFARLFFSFEVYLQSRSE